MEKGTFFSYSWNIDESETNRTVIRIYGLNELNENVCLIVNNFTPYAYIELPDAVKWDNGTAQLVVNKIDEILKDRKPITKQLMFKKRLYYASIDSKQNKKEFPYIFCCFSHTEDIKQLNYKTRRPLNIPRIGIVNIRIHEHNASPILQLTSLRKIPTAGWINFVGRRVKQEDQITHCTHEYTVSWKNLEDKKSDSVARPLCMSFDLEVNSSIPSSMPKAVRPDDKIFQISCVFNRQNAKEDTYDKVLLTLGDVDPEKLGTDIDVLMYETEHDLLLGFTNLIQERQPNIITGYNIFGFDIPYMIDRAKMLYCIYDFDKLGMDKNAHAKEKSISWSSSAYKNQSFQFLDAEGRLFVDLLPLVKRDYKMSNYKLETIAAYFLKGVTKDPLGPKGIFECYRQGMLGGKKGARALAVCGKYCVKDSFLVSRLFEVLTTWVALCEMSKVTNVPIFALYTQGQQLKVFSQVYRKCTHENIVVEKDGYVSKDNDHYVGATVFPPIPGVYDKVLPFDFCLGGETLISLGNGLSKRIKNINNDVVLGYIEEKGLCNFPVINGLQKKGVRDTVKITLVDDTVIVCTPDHKFMLEDGTWCRADELTGKYIKCGLDYPEDTMCHLDKYMNFSDREKILASARIVGYISSWRLKEQRVSFENNIDITNFTTDLCVISEPYIFETTYSVLLEQGTINRLKQYIWNFISEDNCPMSVIREFLAGLCGGEISSMSYNFMVVKSKYNIAKFLKRFNIDLVHSCKITDVKLFHKTIGFRYNFNASYKLSVSSSYLQTSKFTIEEYIAEIKSQDCCIDNHYKIPTFRKRVLSVTPDKPQEVFDIEVSEAHNFIANGAVAHNCSLYPTTIIAYNLCWSTLVSDEKIPDSVCHVMEWSDHQGCQHDPKVVRKTQLNEIIKKHEAEIKEVRVTRDLKRNKDKKPEFEETIKTMIKALKPLRDERTNLNKSKPKHIICCERRFRWLKSPKGVLPEILSHLLDTRAATKKEMKGVKARLKEMKDSGISEDDPAYSDLATYYDVLDQRQLALKVSANSGYGATGTQKGYLPCMPVAMCTTYMGRKAIEKAADSIQKDHGGHLVYGDSVTPDTPILCRYEGLLLYKTIDTISSGDWTPYHGDKEVSTPLTGLEVWTERGFTFIKKVIRHKCHKKIYRVMTPNGVVHVTEDHSLLNTQAEKITPKELHIGSEILVSKFPELENKDNHICSEYNAYLLGLNFRDRKDSLNVILNDSLKNRKAFIQGFLSFNLIYYCDTQKNIAPIYFIAKSVGYNVVINTTENPDIYSLTFSKGDKDIDNKINRLELYSDSYTDFVYDLETENHHFSAGVGEIIVHNTDSNYVSFPELNTTAECWDHAIHVAKVVSQLFPKPINICQVGNRGFEKNATL